MTLPTHQSTIESTQMELPRVVEDGADCASSCSASASVTQTAHDDVAAPQIVMSPYYGKTDFSAITSGATQSRIDPISLADLLRNGFVYPPHSILQDVKLVTFNFDPQDDMRRTPEVHFDFREVDRSSECAGSSEDWVVSYHRLLCNAVTTSCKDMCAPWLLQSGGKDSTTLAIAAAEVRSDTTCITYLGGSEENEVASARSVASTLGLRHETLLCDAARAYDRYLAIVDRMPLLTADFALLSYVDLATEISINGGDGVIDGLGSDNYFGLLIDWQHRWLARLAKGMRLPRFLAEFPLIERNFELSYVLSTLQMDPIERVFPGSRFTDSEVDVLFGRKVSDASKARLDLFRAEMDSANSLEEWWSMASSIVGSAGAVGKGLYTTTALSLDAAYPFCDRQLRDWIARKVPGDQLLDRATMTNKVLVRRHIATRFGPLPYVSGKGSFRFDVRGLAKHRFEQVYDYAAQTRDALPGASRWLERNRRRLDNKYHASKFYLLAIVLPWIAHHGRDAA